MSFDIDMKSFAGASNDSAAGSQTAVADPNSYQQESEYPVDASLMDAPAKADAPEAAQPDVNPQAEHFRALRDEVDRIKAERESEKREHQLQLDMLRANIDRQARPAPTPPQEKQFLDGMKEDDIPNVGELRKEWAQKEAAYQSRLEELQVAQQYPDYAEVLQNFVAPLIRQKPHLGEGIRNSQNSALMAYELGKMAQQAQARPVETRSENAQRIVENAKKPGTLSQAGGQGALSKADYYATMSDQEFMRFAGRNLEGI